MPFIFDEASNHKVSDKNFLCWFVTIGYIFIKAMLCNLSIQKLSKISRSN